MGKRGETLQATVFDVIKRSDTPLSAYDIIGALQPAIPKIAPPTVYRALAALVKRGRVHRLDSLSAYTACKHTDCRHVSILSICERCGGVDERVSPELVVQLETVLDEAGFSAERHVIEVHGFCADCGTEARNT